jgi:hypothetical protein
MRKCSDTSWFGRLVAVGAGGVLAKIDDFMNIRDARKQICRP